MKYTVEESLRNFQFWSGGKDRADNCSADELDRIEEFLEEIEPEDGWTDTAINDIFWFDFDTIAQHLGYEDEEDFDRQHDPNYLDDDDLENCVEEWFASYLQEIKEKGNIKWLFCIYKNCFRSDYLDLVISNEEIELAENTTDYPEWIVKQVYDELLKKDASELMDALFKYDNGYEQLSKFGHFPTKEQFRDEMMHEHKTNNQ